MTPNESRISPGQPRFDGSGSIQRLVHKGEREMKFAKIVFLLSRHKKAQKAHRRKQSSFTIHSMKKILLCVFCVFLCLTDCLTSAFKKYRVAPDTLQCPDTFALPDVQNSTVQLYLDTAS